MEPADKDQTMHRCLCGCGAVSGPASLAAGWFGWFMWGDWKRTTSSLYRVCVGGPDLTHLVSFSRYSRGNYLPHQVSLPLVRSHLKCGKARKRCEMTLGGI